jgi:hypothetical protein
MGEPTARVQGYCPMGCGTTLFLGSGGHVTCAFIDCPDPAAADAILSDGEHVVTIEDDRFHVQHPLRERLNSELHECRLLEWLSEQGGPPIAPGRYRVTVHESDRYSESRRSGSGAWDWQPLEVPARG